MKSHFSEFTYGFALTNEIIESCRRSIGAAPIFPSLVEEGRAGGGYDVNIATSGVPLFLQFKLSHFMSRSNSSEWNLFMSPYYRFELMALRHSQQHDMLLDLERMGNEVYYAAPIFHEISEINKYFSTGRIIDNSIFVNPLSIGSLPDDGYHNICFDPSLSDVYRCSDPLQVEYKKGNELIQNILREGREVKIDKNYLSNLFNEMVGIAQDMKLFNDIKDNIYWNLTKNIEDPITKISILSRTVFECEFLLLRK